MTISVIGVSCKPSAYITINFTSMLGECGDAMGRAISKRRLSVADLNATCLP